MKLQEDVDSDTSLVTPWWNPNGASPRQLSPIRHSVGAIGIATYHGIEPKGDWVLTPGPSYKDQLAALIRESDVFIAVISRLSVASPECHDEIDQARH
jgi:hypothetical protein